MAASGGGRIPGDLHVAGHLSAESMGIPANAITDAAVDPSTMIDSDKIQQRIRKSFGQSNVAAASETRVIHRAEGAGSVLTFRALAIVAAIGAATVTFTLRKNGVSILTGTVSLTSAVAAYTAANGTIATAAYVDGDVFDVVIVATAGGGTLPTGIFCEMIADEAP